MRYLLDLLALIGSIGLVPSVLAAEAGVAIYNYCPVSITQNQYCPPERRFYVPPDTWAWGPSRHPSSNGKSFAFALQDDETGPIAQTEYSFSDSNTWYNFWNSEYGFAIQNKTDPCPSPKTGVRLSLMVS